MDSTLNSAHPAPQGDGDAVPLAPKDCWTGVEEALSKLAREAARGPAERRTPTMGSDFAADLRVIPVEATLHAFAKPDPSLSRSPSLTKRATGALARYLITALIAVAAAASYQSYGGALQGMIASLAPFEASPAPKTSLPRPELAAGQTALSPAIQAPAPAQAVPAAQTTPEIVAPPSASVPDLQQIEDLSRDLAAVRERVEQLAGVQEQMTRAIANLQAAEQEISHRIATPGPRPTAAPARKPVSTSAPPPPTPAPEVSSAPPPPPEAPPGLRPPMPVPVR